jgi:uncharacterized protein YodC (DUF2158 family)
MTDPDVPQPIVDGEARTIRAELAESLEAEREQLRPLEDAIRQACLGIPEHHVAGAARALLRGHRSVQWTDMHGAVQTTDLLPAIAIHNKAASELETAARVKAHEDMYAEAKRDMEAQIAKWKSAAMRQNEREAFEKKLEVLERMMGELAEVHDIPGTPDCWAKVCVAANLALEVALAISMTEIAATLHVDTQWLTGLPALVSKRANAAAVKSHHEQAVGDARPLDVGDVVMLNSGGPKMTLTWFNSTRDEVRVEWFAGDGSAASRMLPLASLRRE